jgi:HD-GYP domain-containing protein (c-di-GMP phosphodiesterase class II)
MVPTIQETTEIRDRSANEQAKALAVVLREEFGVPFRLFDIAEGSRTRHADERAAAQEETDRGLVAELAAGGRARVLARPDGRYTVGLLLYAARKPAFVALGTMTAISGTSTSAAARELAVLQSWAQAVSDRLRLSDQLTARRRSEEVQTSQVTASFEALLAVDQLVRRLRVHRDAARNPQRVVETAFKQLQAQSVLWVPLQSDQQIIAQGENALKPEECRQLARALNQIPELQGHAPLLCNQVRETAWGARFPQIDNLMAFVLREQGPVGWFIVLNRKGRTPFRRSDAALVLPFVALLEMYFRWSHKYQDLKDLLVGLTRSLTTALDAKDPYTYGHSERVARTAVELGRELGLDGDELGDIYLSGLLHDVGKIGIRDTVLHKPGALTPEEREHIQQHVIIGYSILADLRQIRSLLPGVLYHHERYDGTGYPDRLAGENIPLLARILAVADAYDAMSHPRPYRDAMPCQKVEEILRGGAGQQWDKQVVDAFFRCLQRIHAIRQRGVGDSLRVAIDGALRSVTGSGTASIMANLQPFLGLPPSETNQ